MQAKPAETFRFSRDRRIRRRADFLRIQNDGKRVTTDSFVLLLAAGPDLDAPSRLGLVVTRKVGGAVVRNRIKRLCREAFRLWPDLLPRGTDMVVIARRAVPEMNLAWVRGEWGRVARLLFKRAGEIVGAARKTRLAQMTSQT